MKDQAEKNTRLYKLVVDAFGEANAPAMYQQFMDESQQLNPDGIVGRSYAYIAMRRFIEQNACVDEDAEANA